MFTSYFNKSFVIEFLTSFKAVIFLLSAGAGVDDYI